jgi:hypothetical protein
VLGLPPNRHWRDALAWYLSARPQPVGQPKQQAAQSIE